jgi:hypothetical protein
MINFKILLLLITIIILVCFIFTKLDMKYTKQINEKMSIVSKPIKILRIGMTESTLLFIFWCEKYKKINFKEMKEAMIRWFYTTSGYYDKSMEGNYFNVTHSVNDPEIYIKYFDKLLEFFKNSEYLCLLFHNFNDENKIIYENKNIIELKEEFKKTINNNILKSIPKELIYDFIKDKNILIISPFSPLVKQQIDSGNCKKIYNNFPDIKNVMIYRHIYTFFNNGPNQNILETCEKIFNDIIQLINIELYDTVIISCGAYSNLYAEKFFNLQKNVCTIGGELHEYFGIMNNRNRKGITVNQEYYINYIPDEYKPEGYMKIEDGCYW